MPKIINNLQEKILSEAKKQIFENGYGATTIRSIAKGCGIAVGTLYNYFESKEIITATFMLEDWQKAMSDMKDKTHNTNEKKYIFEAVFCGIREYQKKYNLIFADTSAIASSAGSFAQRHNLLVNQIKNLISDFLDDYDEFTVEFLAENLLMFSNSGRSFDDVWRIIQKIIN